MISGTLVILDNEVYEVLKVDFGCLVYLKKYYDEGQVMIIERDIKVVEGAISNMMCRGVKGEQLI